MKGLAVFLACILSATAWVHDAPSGHTYPPACCSPDDHSQLCHPVECDEIGQDDQGRYRWRNLTFKRENVFSTFDNQCHVCNSWDWLNGEKHPTYGFCVMIRSTVDQNAAIKWTVMYDSWRRRDIGK